MMKRKHQDYTLVPFPATHFALRLKELIEESITTLDQFFQSQGEVML